ncbi:MAG: AAA family ATPase, partial [Bacteroidales bacterium]|nr:AAA family ATPase [Bacteroidales bacterium]
LADKTSRVPVIRQKKEFSIKPKYISYSTALRTKPFMLLAGISGTGKSRIVRELAKACWKEGDEEYGKNNPKNFCMVQVKPNWHDSSELIGYVSRINGEKYVVGPFLRFLAKAINDPDTPYFLCLDEMNLAPVEQYFAEYLSVIESRKLNADGSITTDPIVPYENTEAYGTLIDQLFYDDADRKEYKSETGTKRLTIPQNLFVIGTVNMDETTFSFSRKVLDRAMTIEMNEVDLHGGLTDEGSEIGYIGNSIIGNAAEGKDVYADNKDLCDQVLTYLEKVNTVLEGTPFKIAYRTRNEFLLYAVNRQLLDKDSQLWQTLDEMTSMKILSRIEGDSERTKKVLEELKKLVDEEITTNITDSENQRSISAAKIKEMLDKLSSGYTSYWA